jgi:hypothetical protein
MIELKYEMTYAETIEGPLGPTVGSCWETARPQHQQHREAEQQAAISASARPELDYDLS